MRQDNYQQSLIKRVMLLHMSITIRVTELGKHIQDGFHQSGILMIHQRKMISMIIYLMIKIPMKKMMRKVIKRKAKVMVIRISPMMIRTKKETEMKSFWMMRA